MKLVSQSFTQGSLLDKRYTLYGENVAPHIRWENLPAETKSLAIIVDDPDAPTENPWVHAVGYDIDPSLHQLPEGAWDMVTGATDFDNETGYQGPRPPKGHGIHHYHFKVYALDTFLHLPPGKTKRQVEESMKDHVLASAEIIATYEAL